MRYFTGALTLTAVLAATSSPAVAVTITGPPIHVSKCDPQLNAAPLYGPGYYPYPANRYYWRDVYGYRYYQPPIATSSPTLSIDYINRTDAVMKHIQFGLVANGRLVAEVRDVGTFSPGAEIKHSFGLSPNVFPLQTGLPHCVPLRIEFADGTVWKNPHLPELHRSMYAPGPG
ncbi:MAG TPA: hypothetical protein VMG98_07355 [Verrucomicrobiae bacterium]|nr:hypothetical protein [Verrucomicrobiae bacterium]